MHLFWYRDVFFWLLRWPKSPCWYQDLFFGLKILHSVVQHLDRLLPGINQCFFWTSTSCKLEVQDDVDTEKKIQISRYPKKDISIPTKRSEGRKWEVGSVVVGFGVFGAPRFSVQRS